MSDLLTGEPNVEGNSQTPIEGEGNTNFTIPEFLSGISGIEELGEDILGEPCLKPIKDVPTLLKNYVNAQRMVGKDKVIIPGEQSSPEDIENFYRKLGKPEALDKFDIELPEETIVEKEFYEGFKQFAFDNNILPKQANAMVKYMEEYEAKQNESFQSAAKENQEKAINELKEEWADAYEGNLQVANTVVKEFASDEIKQYLKETGLANDTKLVKFLAEVGQSLYKEKKLDSPQPSTGMTKEQANRRYNEIKADPAYWDKTAYNHDALRKEIDNMLKSGSIER